MRKEVVIDHIGNGARPSQPHFRIPFFLKAEVESHAPAYLILDTTSDF